MAMDFDALRSGCGGGVTGGSSGVLLSRDGRLWGWKRDSAGSAIKLGPVIGVDAAAATRLFGQALSEEFKLIRYRQMGSRTCWVQISGLGDSAVVEAPRHGVYWTDPQNAPALALGLFEALEKLRRDLTAVPAGHYTPK